ncbi:MAG: shikimate kinase [Planctomycetota bacterium]
MNLILIGYRGCGKSTIGPLVARRLRQRFVDLDDLIVEQTGKTIRQIFSEESEAGFRSRERASFQKIRKLKDCVIALGGGAVMDPENRALTRRMGKVVWLRAPAVVLWSRIKADPASAETRPALTPGGGLAEVEETLARREPLYRRAAHHTIDTVSASAEAVAESIELWFRANDAGRA